MTSSAPIMQRKSIIRGTSTSELAAMYDYCMIFKLEDQGGHFVIPATAKWVVGQMIEAGLETFSYKSVQEDELITLIRCPAAKMKRFADVIDFKMELVPEKVKEHLEQGVIEGDQYTIKPVFINDDVQYTPYSPYNFIFGKYDEGLDQGLYADFENEQTRSAVYDPENVPFNKYIRLKLLYYILKAPHSKGGCDLELNKMIFKKQILAFFPLHDKIVTQQFSQTVLKLDCYPWTFPFNDFRFYFGEKISLFLVFMGHYSKWLIIPAVIGFIFQLIVWGTLDYSSPVLPFFSVLITIWAIMMLEYWKREEKTTALVWGMTDFESEEPDRPEFHGDLIRSYIDGSHTLYFPSSEFFTRFLSSQLIIATFIFVVIGVVSSIYVLRFSLQSDIGAYASTVASVVNTVQITVFNMIYQKVVVKLTDIENHRTDTQYEDSLIVKLFMFQFVNSYASFFFLAFVAQYLDKPNDTPDNYVGECGYENCMQPLSVNLAIIFITRLVTKGITDTVVPYFQSQMKRKAETQPGSILTPAEENYILMEFDALLENINNYADAALQYGFSTLFVTALPMAPFFSILSNYFRVKAVAWKLSNLYQRPIPVGAQDIGVWLSIFQFVSVASVVTNAGLICFTMDVLSEYSAQGRAWIFIGFQWTLIFTQFLVEAVIPDEPEEVQIQERRMDFIVSKIILKTPDEDPTPIEEYKRRAHTSMYADHELEEEKVEGCLRWIAKGGASYVKKHDYAKAGDVTVEKYPSNGMVGNPMVQV